MWRLVKLQNAVPKVNCSLCTWSVLFAFSGCAKDRRRGPNGEDQEKPIPVE
jgi:hypothetical protein